MALTIFDVTPETPTVNSSEGFVAYADLGPRPICSTCETIEDCPECGSDGPYNIPVVAGDMIYLQLREEDLFNDDPQNPTVGWKEGVEDFWIKATLSFSDGTQLNLDAGGTGYAASIIAGQEVGYFNGEYQNLVLNSMRIQDYLNSTANNSTCFEVIITTYKAVPPVFLSILNFYEVLPPIEVMGVTIQDGVIIWVQDTGLFYISSGGEWVVYDSDATLVYNQKTGKYYEFAAEEWFETTLEFTTEQNTVCTKPSYQFALCEQTVIVEGSHGETDCRGNYYGGTIQFRDRYRLWASFELNEFANEKTINDNNVLTDFTSYERYLFRGTKALPPLFAKIFNNTLLGQTVYIENNSYVNITDLSKNNDNGLYWWFSITADRLLCEKTQNCAEEVVVNPLVICPEPQCPEIADEATLVGELGDYNATAICGEITIVPAATVEDTEGNILGQVDAGETLVVDCSGGDPSGTCEPATVENSDASFSESIASGGTYVLEDYTVNVYVDGVLEDTQTAPAMTDLEINIIWN